MTDAAEIERIKDHGDVRSEEMLLNMGPQHPSTHGVFRVVIRSDGEIILDAESHIGYLHRCFEKICESVNYTKATPYTDRLDYLMAMGNNLGYALAVEKLLGVEVPERAQYIRVIVTELSRIASHLLAIGTYGMDIGAITPFLYCFRDREKILYILETICGQRLNYNYVRIGGVAYDVDDAMLKMTREFCDYFLPRVMEYNDLLTYNGIFLERTGNVGVLPADLAIAYGCTGPVLRGSGVKRDLRKDAPYAVYDRFDFEIPVGSGEAGTVGDCFDRYMVRMREMIESTKIIQQALDQIPEGDFKHPKVKLKPKVPAGDAYTAVENARGELGFYLIADGSDTAFRLKCRSPAFSNVSVLHEISRGAMVADMVAIIGSLDIVMGEIDR
ncbi:MAG TPA: NADH-quinone oxidoreductase subunit D [Planctomycetes bacterium]|nr:NADH-quinone oxidoreductase subunit D [Planctomycetota bacterium]